MRYLMKLRRKTVIFLIETMAFFYRSQQFDIFIPVYMKMYVIEQNHKSIYDKIHNKRMEEILFLFTLIDI